MDRLLSTVQRKSESVRDYIERFRNLSLMCLAGMPLSMLLQNVGITSWTKWRFVWELSKPIPRKN